ncbi:MAG: hypothetical protein JNM09_05140 [Blastocatellia bacterium]|nr:hypothetical protein [Blastocatellia bacterium]
MSRRHILPLLFCVMAAVSAVAQTANPDPITALQSEIRQLRLELIQQRMEFQQWKIAQLEAVLKAAKEEREAMEAEERAIHQSLTEVTTSEGDESARFRTELTETSLRKLQIRQTASQQRESDLQQKLAQEQTILQELSERARRLSAGR